MAAFLVTFLLFILFFIVIPVGISPFEAPKVILAELVIELLVIARLFKIKKSDFKNFLHSQAIFIAVLFFLSLVDFLIFKPEGTFFGNLFRLQGLLLFWHLLLWPFLSADINIEKIQKWLLPLAFITLLLGTLILGVNQNNRAFGTLGEPNALATTALFFFPFMFFLYKKRLLRTGVILATLAIISLASSRAGLLGFITQGILLLSYYRVKLSLYRSTSIVIIFMLVSLILPLTQSSLLENRSQIWQTALVAGLKSPIIGQGFGNIQKPIHDTAIALNNPVQYQVVDSSHNFVLDFWVQGGIVGVLSVLILIFLTLQSFVSRKKIVELAAFLGLITAMLFNPVSVVHLIAFWWLIGQGFANSDH